MAGVSKSPCKIKGMDSDGKNCGYFCHLPQLQICFVIVIDLWKIPCFVILVICDRFFCFFLVITVYINNVCMHFCLLVWPYIYFIVWILKGLLKTIVMIEEINDFIK